MTTQSIPACLVLAAIGGMMNVLSTAILAYPDAEKLRGNPWSPCKQHMALLLSLLFQGGIAASNISATWFGPVSLVVPTTASSQLLFNMVLFGWLLGLESFSKEMRVGAYIVGLAAILLPVVGPGIQEDQDVLLLLQRTGSIVWSSILLTSFVLSSIGLALSDIRRKRDSSTTDSSDRHDPRMFAFILMADTSGAVVGTTVSKMFVLVQGETLGICISLWLLTALVLVYAAILKATAVPQGKFVPLSVASKISVNAITGIIIWEDWRVVTSWIGYVCVFLYLILGNYLLCDVDLFGAQNSTYGTAATFKKVMKAFQDGTEQEDESDSHPPQPAQSSSTAEAGDWNSIHSSVSIVSSSSPIDDVSVELAEVMKESPMDSDMETVESSTQQHAPRTASGVWRQAYHVEKDARHQAGLNEEPQNEWEADIYPRTPSGVWRTAYKVEKHG